MKISAKKLNIYPMMFALGIHAWLFVVLSILIPNMPIPQINHSIADYCRVDLVMPVHEPKLVQKIVEQKVAQRIVKNNILRTKHVEQLLPKPEIKLTENVLPPKVLEAVNPPQIQPVAQADKIENNPQSDSGYAGVIAIEKGAVSLSGNNFSVPATKQEAGIFKGVGSVNSRISHGDRRGMNIASALRILGSAQTGEGTGSPTDELSAYKQQVFSKILAAKFYPQSARKRGIKGVSVLRFLLSKDGLIKSVDLVESSTYEVLDQAAIQTIQAAAPFLPFPPGIVRDEIWLKLAISFSLES